MVGTCRSHIWPHKRPLSSLTFWLVLDQLFHLALFQCVYHIRQAALASLRGSKGAHGQAAVAAGPSPTSAFLFAWWGSIVLGIRTQGAPLAIVLLEKGRRGNIIRFKDYLTFKTEKNKVWGGKSEEEVGEELAWAHSVSLSFLLLFSPSLPLRAHCNQLSSTARFLKLGRTSSSSSSHILWNLHLTDLEVLDRRNTWNSSKKAPHTLRVTLTPHYKAFCSASLRDVQHHGTKPPSFHAAPLLSKESWQLMLRMQFHHVRKSEKNRSLFGKQSFGAVSNHFHKFMKGLTKQQSAWQLQNIIYTAHSSALCFLPSCQDE